MDCQDNTSSFSKKNESQTVNRVIARGVIARERWSGMKITPLDIRKQEFGRQVRGFDMDEVRSFLEMVADEFEVVVKRTRELAKEAQTYRAQVEELQKKEHSLHDSMKDIQQLQRERSEKATEEARYIRQKAMLEADQILHDARKKREQITDQIHHLEGQRRGYIIKIRHVLESQLDLMKILEEDIIRDDTPPAPAPDQAIEHEKIAPEPSVAEAAADKVIANKGGSDFSEKGVVKKAAKQPKKSKA